MKTLRIVHAGIKNGDKNWLERAAKKGLKSTPTWVIPKSATVGDDVVFYIGGIGFFATGIVQSTPTLRVNWKNRYGAAIDSIRLIKQPISLASIRKHLPKLTWAISPQSIHTPKPAVADLIRKFLRGTVIGL